MCADTVNKLSTGSARDEEPISARIPRTLRERLEELAVEGDRTLSAEIRRALRFYVHSKTNGKKAA